MKKISLLLLLLITACFTTKSDFTILDDSKCELPCWNNLIPGATPYEEAIQIIKGLNGVDQKNIVALNQPWKIFNKRISFYLNPESLSSKTSIDGEAYFINDNLTVLKLNRNSGLTFEEMIKRIGEPENIVSMPFHGSVPVIMAINLAKGVEFEFYAISDELQPETKIDSVMFFDPTHYEELLDAEMFSLGEYDANDTKKIMYSWQGYGCIEILYPPKFP